MAVISSAGILIWMGTDFFGGMMIFLISYWFLIIPIIGLYIVSFLQTWVAIIKNGFILNKIKTAAHFTVLVAFVFFNMYHSDLFKSKRILTATLKDDLFHYQLVLRENGTCENVVSGMLGFTETFYGNYLIKNDTLIFTKVPYDNDFIPDTLLIDKKSDAIYTEKDSNGNFIRKKSYLNHFIIHR